MAGNQNILQLTQQTGSADTTSVLYAVAGSGSTDTGLPLSVLFNNVTLGGTPIVPGYLTSALAASTYLTQANATSTYVTQSVLIANYSTSAQIAATYATITNLALKAPIASPTFTGTVTIPTGASIAGFAPLASPALTGTATLVNATYSGLITPSTTVGIKGTTLADNAQAGSIGEVLTSAVTGVSMTSATTSNITSLTLTAGDWDVTGNVQWTSAGTTVPSNSVAGLNTTSATFGALGTYSGTPPVIITAGGAFGFVVPMQRVNVTTSTVVYLVGNIAFSTSTLTASGTIFARRRR